MDLHKHYLLEWAQFSFEGYSEYTTPKYATSVYWLFWDVALEKQQMQKEIFSEFLLSAWKQSFQKELNCHKSPPQEFHPQGTL